MTTMLRWKLFIGGCMITTGVILLLICDWMPQFRNIVLLSGALIPVGFLLIVLSLITTRYERENEVMEDERTLKIRAQSSMKALSFSITIVLVLLILVCSGVIVIDAVSAIIVIVLIMTLSSSLLYWYYNRQGDINKD